MNDVNTSEAARTVVLGTWAWVTRVFISTVSSYVSGWENRLTSEAPQLWPQPWVSRVQLWYLLYGLREHVVPAFIFLFCKMKWNYIHTKAMSRVPSQRH